MKRPVLHEVPLDEVVESLVSGRPSVNVTMGAGQWDGLLQAAYDAGHNLIELDDNEVPVKAYRKETVSKNGKRIA
jgi:hypothetical protein